MYVYMKNPLKKGGLGFLEAINRFRSAITDIMSDTCVARRTERVGVVLALL